VSAIAERVPELCAVYPLAVLALAVWNGVLASIELGHWPIPSLDDPGDVSLIWFCYPMSMVALMLWPFPAIVGTLWTLFDGLLAARWWVTGARTLALFVANLLMIAGLRHDAWRIGEWLLD
jgi:hypothetical protein